MTASSRSISGAPTFAAAWSRPLRKRPDLSKASVWSFDLWRHADDKPTREGAAKRLVRMLKPLIATADNQGLKLAPFVGIACPGVIRADGSIGKGAQNLPSNWESSKFNLPESVTAAIPKIGDHDTAVLMHNDAVAHGLSKVPFVQGVDHWGVLTIGTGLGNARFGRDRLHWIGGLIWTDHLLSPRLLEIPGHDHDSETRAAIEEQRVRGAPRAVGVKHVLPQVALHHLRDEHGDRARGMLLFEPFDQFKQRPLEATIGRLNHDQLRRTKPRLADRPLDILSSHCRRSRASFSSSSSGSSFVRCTAMTSGERLSAKASALSVRRFQPSVVTNTIGGVSPCKESRPSSRSRASSSS
jgi:hypothetical protein